MSRKLTRKRVRVDVDLRFKSPKGTVQHRVFSAIRSTKQPMTCAEIAAYIDLSQESVRMAMRELLKSGRVTKLGGTRYARYILVPGAANPIDRRGMVANSRANLRPSTAEVLLARHMAWRNGGGTCTKNNTRTAAQELERLWRWVA